MHRRSPRHTSRVRSSQAADSDEQERRLAYRTAAILLSVVIVLQFLKVMMASPVSSTADPAGTRSLGYMGPLVFEVVLVLILWTGDKRGRTFALPLVLFSGTLGTWLYLQSSNLVGAAIEVAVFGGLALVLAGRPNRLRTAVGGATCALGCLGVMVSFVVPV